MSESASMWTAVIAGIGFLGVLTTQIFTLISQRDAAKRVEVAADKVEEVKVIAAEILETGDKTHNAVNGTLLKTQESLAVALRKIATDSKAPADIKAAEIAEKDAAVHKKEQEGR